MIMPRSILLACLILGSGATALPAQHIHIRLTGGTTERFRIEEVRGISYADGRMHLHRYDGADLTWRVADVEHFHFYEPTAGFDAATRAIAGAHIFKLPAQAAGAIDIDVINRAIAELNAQRYPQAVALLDPFIEAHPTNEYALLLRGNARRLAGEHEAAITEYTRALAVNPIYFNAFLNRGTSYHELGRADEALADSDRAIEADPQNARGYHMRGYMRYTNGDYAAARSDYDRSIELDPTDAYVYIDRGVLRSERSDPHGAITDYRASLEHEPALAWAWNNLGNVVLNLANMSQEAALEIMTEHFGFEEDIEILPGAGNVLGNPRLKVAVYDLAIRHYDRAIEIDPADGNAHGNKALALMYRGSIEEACRFWQKAFELGDEDAAAYQRSMCR
jgi:tetratricopeptide (TPR) repeat protein